MRNSGMWSEHWPLSKMGRFPSALKFFNPFPVVVPPRHPLASVYQVHPSDVHGEKELVLRTDQPGTVDVDVQNTQRSLLEVKGSLRMNSRKRTNFSIDGVRYLQPMKRIMDVLTLCNTRSPLALPTAGKGIDRFQHPCSLRKLLQGMLDSGVVTESSSPRAAPIVLVKKKDS